MKKVTLRFGKRERGFTLIELLIVIAILGVLAAVVVPNVMGLFGRGGEQAYDSDVQTIQTSVATFYGDVHDGPDGNTAGDAGDNTDYQNNTWCDTDGIAGHYMPTATGLASGGAPNAEIADGTALPLATDSTDLNGEYNAERVYVDVNEDGAFTVADRVATDEDIAAAAIWMGLLVNGESTGDAAGRDRDDSTTPIVAAQTGEESMYLTEYPKSCSTTQGAALEGNGKPDNTGTYTWIVADNGKVLGVYRTAANAWYAGFSGNYP